MSTDAEGLRTRCAGILGGAGRAIDWVRDVRRNAPRLDRDGDALTEKLRRTRNLCRRLGVAATRPFSVGVFGMSQAGKSYLISTLARSPSGQLETSFDGVRYNFIGHINPPGGGKEATGLVTRFTRRPSTAPKGYPIELTLLSEADLIKILGNSFFNDFDRERVAANTDPEHIRQHLQTFAPLRQSEPVGGLDEDGLVDVFDYFDQRYAKSMEPLRSDFWPAVIDLAPRLPGPARGKLLSILWGEIDALTDVYVKLREAIAQMGGAARVYAPLEALVRINEGRPEWNPESLINVDVLNHLGRDGATPITVLPVIAGDSGTETAGSETSVARSLLAALTAEIKFVLADEPVVGLLRDVDLLDFPGYRGRLSVASVDEVRREIEGDNIDPVAQLLLRGKVAFLFERYTDDQEMNVLIMCTKCDSQIEITSLAPVLSAWVHTTQGDTPEERSGRLPGLIWVLTQLDLRLKAKPGLSPSQELQEWNNMIHITLLERFKQCDWLQQWASGRPFDNVFLVRKPGLFSSVAVDDTHHEQGFLPGELDRLERQKQLFLEAGTVARYVRSPGDAWDAVLQLNDGGMARLAAYLGEVSLPKAKTERIGAQVARVTEELIHRLGPYYFAEGAGEVERKKALAARVTAAVTDQADGFGELLALLQPSSEQLRRLYLRSDPAAVLAAEPGAAAAIAIPTKRVGLVRLPLPGNDARQEQPPAVAGRALSFAKLVIREWIRQLRELPENAEVRRFLALPAEVLLAVTDEIVTAADRHHIEDRIIETLRPLEEKRSTTRIGIVDQQVLQARRVIDDFVDYLGYAETPLSERPNSPVERRRLFEPPAPVAVGALPVFPQQEFPYTGTYIVEWLAAFRLMAIDNAGHSAGREITPDQNQRLGEVLKMIGGDAVAAGA